MDMKGRVVLLIAHGSREEIANQEVCEMAQRMEKRLDRVPVIACFLDVASPDIPEGFRQAASLGACQITAIPFFLATGAHVGQDIPRILEDCRKGHPGIEVRITAAVGPDPGLDAIALERMHQASWPDQKPSGGRPMAQESVGSSPWLHKQSGIREEFRSVCGFRRNILTPADETRISISHLRINDSRNHYHKVLEEVYYVLKGEGSMSLDGEKIPLRPGDAVVVRPGVRHHAEGDIEVLIICCPPFEDGDCFYDE